MTARSRRLVIMAKEPRPGAVKTRLQPALTPEEAAELYRCLLFDRLEEMQSLDPGVSVALAYSPPEGRQFFLSATPPSFALVPQATGSLSERLVEIFQGSFSEGCRGVSIVDSDTPDLSGPVILESFRLLADGADAVFGPCRDGGYYLVGLREPRPALFDGIPWSTATVLATSLSRARELGLQVRLLEPLRDIDHLEDLKSFYARHRGGSSTSGTGRTAAFAAGLHRAGRLDPPAGRGGMETP